jgi:hypothetical protein
MAKNDLRFSVLLALAAVLTIGLKVELAAFNRKTDSRALTRMLEAHLAAQGFSTRYELHANQSDVVEAVRGACRLRVRDGTKGDQFDKVFARQANGLGPVRYVFHGLWLARPPLLWMGIERSLAHMSARLGLSGQYQTAFAIAARGCDPATINLDGIHQTWMRSG